MFLPLWRIQRNSQQVAAGKFPPVCLSHKGSVWRVRNRNHPAIFSSESIKDGLMFPLSFWTHHELNPQPELVCGPKCAQCWGARGALLPWAHSLNWNVSLVSLLSECWRSKANTPVMSRCTFMTLCSTEAPSTHAHTIKKASNQGHQGLSLRFSDCWVISSQCQPFFPTPSAKRKWRDDLPALLHSSLPEKTNRNTLWPACWPTAHEQLKQATAGVYFRMSYLNW